MEDGLLYQKVAERIENLIDKEVLRVGDKLMSVRALQKEQGVSMSTAYKAYLQLESKGLIEARPKSGYYVRFIPKHVPALSPTPSFDKVEDVSVDVMVKLVFQNLHQEGVISLSLATPAQSLLPAAKLNKALAEAIRRSKYSCLNYEEVQGNLKLRQQIAKYAFNWGGNISADDVIITQGCMEAVSLCLKTITNPGDIIAIDSPTYFGIYNIMKNSGLKVIEIPSHPKTGTDLDFLEKAISEIPIKACLFTPNFNNPIGTLMPDENKKHLVDLLSRHNIPLIEDDIYGDLYFGKSRPRNCKTFDQKGLVLFCTSISKSLAPGYRVGWCIPGKFKTQVLSQKMVHNITSPTPTQFAIGLFFENGRFDLHMRHLRKALYTQCLLYLQAISSYFPKDIKVSQPQGGYVLWIALHPSINAFDLYKKAIKRKISIAPGQIFSSGSRYKNYIRISFGHPYTTEIDESMKILGSLVKEFPT